MSAAARKELTAAVLGAAGGGALALVAGGQSWARVTAVRDAPLPPVTAALAGAEAAPLVPAAGLVLLAAAVALVAVRGAGRVVVGLLMAAAGGVLAWSGIRALTGGLSDAASQVPGVGRGAGQVTVDVRPPGRCSRSSPGCWASVPGLLAVLRGRTWPAMGRRYERSGAADRAPPPRRPQTDEDRAQAAWKALDRGDDPTADPSPTGDRP